MPNSKLIALVFALAAGRGGATKSASRLLGLDCRALARKCPAPFAKAAVARCKRVCDTSGFNFDLRDLRLRAKPRFPLERCGALFPAGTGTASFWNVLHAGGFPESAIGHAERHDRRPSRAHPCYLVTLRDTVGRIQSGWRHSTRRTYFGEAGPASINAWVEQIRRGGHRDFLARTRCKQSRPIASCNDGMGFRRFIMSQIDYLRYFTRAQDLYPVCLNGFAGDIGRVNKAHSSRLVLKHHLHHRATGHDPSSTLTEENARFWRECVAPWDERFYELMCGNASRVES